MKRDWLKLGAYALLPLSTASIYAQRIDRVVNAASYVDVKESGRFVVAPRSLITIFGDELAGGTLAATSTPLPTTLAGVRVWIGDKAAPLLYVSPKQINLQVPNEMPVGAVDLRIERADAGTATSGLVIRGSQLGLFTATASGCGQAAAMNLAADGTLTPNTSANSFDPNKHTGLVFWGTGMGTAPKGAADGIPWVFDPSVNFPQFKLFLGRQDLERAQNWRTDVTYAGPAPGFIGLDQINALKPALPQELPQGCSVPVYSTDMASTASQLATVSVRNGGGTCLDPAPDSYAVFRWYRKKTYTGDSITQENGLQVHLAKAPNLRLIPVDRSATTIVPFAPEPATCPDTLPAIPQLGVLSLVSPSGATFEIAPEKLPGPDVELPLSADFGSPGEYHIRSEGGVDAPGFVTSTTIPPEPIRIQTDFLVSGLDRENPIIRWDRLNDVGTVVASIIAQEDRPADQSGSLVSSQTSTVVSAGQVALAWYLGSKIAAGTRAQISIRVYPGAQDAVTRVQGISQGMIHSWFYEYTFQDVLVR